MQRQVNRAPITSKTCSLSKMIPKKRIALNVTLNWIAMVVGMLVPFFLTPIVIRSLGNIAYGIWILSVATVGYLGLLDLGLRSAVIRYVSKAEAQGNDVDARNAIGAALWFRILLAVCAVVLSLVLALEFPHLFKIPNGLTRPAQITVLMCAIAVAVTLVSGVFGAVLSAIHRFDLLSGISVIQTAIKTAGILLILRSGRGLVALAYWELTVTLLAGVATWLIAARIFPASRVGFGRPDLNTLKMIWSYSLTTFIIIIAAQVIFSTDNIVVGAFVSVASVVFYSIGGSLIMYSRQLVASVATTFGPMASNLEASGDSAGLRKLLFRGTHATLGMAIPVSLVLLFRGKTFIMLWMGQKYSTEAGTVLQILMISQFLWVANATAGQIAYGIERHKSVAKWSIIEASLNFSLSILLAKTIGMYGVAWGTSVAAIIIQLLFWPRFVRKELGVPIRAYLWDGWGKVTLCAIPFAITCALADRYWHPHSMLVFFMQILITLPVYVAPSLLIFKDELRMFWTRWKNSRTPAPQEA